MSRQLSNIVTIGFCVNNYNIVVILNCHHFDGVWFPSCNVGILGRKVLAMGVGDMETVFSGIVMNVDSFTTPFDTTSNAATNAAADRNYDNKEPNTENCSIVIIGRLNLVDKTFVHSCVHSRLLCKIMLIRSKFQLQDNYKYYQILPVIDH